jgi:flagellar FliL protein
MAGTAEAEADGKAPARKSRMPLLIGIVLALASGGGGYLAVSSGLLFSAGAAPDAGEAAEPAGHAEAGAGDGAATAPEGNATETASHGEDGSDPASPAITYSENASFVPLQPIILALGEATSWRHLKFSAQVEVEPGSEAAVSNLSPRILDIMNTYLRAVDEQELADKASLIRIRMHLLRRIQVIVGEGRVRDFLITEFVLT